MRWSHSAGLGPLVFAAIGLAGLTACDDERPESIADMTRVRDGRVIIDMTRDMEPDAAGDMRVVPDGGAPGQPCDRAEACASGHCIQTCDTRVCGRLCSIDQDCDPGSRCQQVANAVGVAFLCLPEVCPSPEECDADDNDGDGRIDEGEDAAPLTRPCANPLPNEGACRPGVERCIDGRWSRCEDAVQPVDETCNGVDDDCDGEIDEGRDGEPLHEACASEGLAGERRCDLGRWGECVTAPDCDDVICEPPEGCCAARRECDADGVLGDCVCTSPRGAENCDGKDNDCDGLVDNVDGVGMPCMAGVGECAMAGVNRCDVAANSLICDASAGRPGLEICDARDNDCDGVIDEAAPTPCVIGLGQCRGIGETRCDAGEVTCQPDPNAPTPRPERCNAIDDDCDGRVDEGTGGEICCEGEGRCAGCGSRTCRDGGLECALDAPPANPAPETCNGVDDDCDGVVDEADHQVGRFCETGEPGRCASGRWVCAGGSLECVPANQPEAEACNGSDDDCDGISDESDLGGPLTRPCYTGRPDTLGEGICRSGRRRCEQGNWSDCEGEVTPTVEQCDGVDGDCNGEPDQEQLRAEGCNPCEPGNERVTYDGPDGTRGVGACRDGLQVCGEDRQWHTTRHPILPAEERCDQIDNDCDEEVDEVARAGEPCDVGSGRCRREGVLVCEGAALVCNVTPGEPDVEICNGLDDNCSGVIDDVPGLGDPCIVGVGECRGRGELVCAGDGEELRCNAVRGAPAVEVCNGRDDDCDGEVDNVARLGEACRVGVGQCVRNGQFVCSDNAGVVCSATVGQSGQELCNGLDDDCDGAVDEDANDVGRRCQTGRPGRCSAGVLRCLAGELSCRGELQAVDETCDAVDQDCDGSIDESPDGGPLRQACYDGLPPDTEGIGNCRGGMATCINGEYGPCVDQQLPAAPGCSGDRDCDGEDDFDPDRCACVPGESFDCGVRLELDGIGICRSGQQSCDEDGQPVGECVGAIGPSGEICDGLDNDCNFRVDDVDGRGALCEVGRGECRRIGFLDCPANGGPLECDATPGEPAREICDGIDNDCDGVIDEGEDQRPLEVPCYDGPPATADVGECQSGVQRCVDGRFSGCIGQVLPSDEVCDAADRNCDGSPHPTGVGESCGSGIGRCHQEGEVICRAGSLVCDAVPGDPIGEFCNEVDDDCDGEVDNTPGSNAPCCVGVGACERCGLTTCDANALVCNAQVGAPSPELCDAIDNDCDGVFDEEGPEYQRILEQWMILSGRWNGGFTGTGNNTNDPSISHHIGHVQSFDVVFRYSASDSRVHTLLAINAEPGQWAGRIDNHSAISVGVWGYDGETSFRIGCGDGTSVENANVAVPRDAWVRFRWDRQSELLEIWAWPVGGQQPDAPVHLRPNCRDTNPAWGQLSFGVNVRGEEDASGTLGYLGGCWVR